jgi:hypothetical protein
MIVERIKNQEFTKPIKMMGNERNVYSESIVRCCQTVKMFFGMFYSPPMEKRKKLAII